MININDNLGGLLAKHLKARNLHLLTHNKEVAKELKNQRNVRIFKADLAQKDSLYPALTGVDVVIHFAGVLFRANPEKFLPTTTAAIDSREAQGIYHIGDEGIQTLQEFLDRVAAYKKYHKPWRMPLWMIMSAAWIFEFFSFVFDTGSPLTRDFIRIGRVSYYGDTTRMRKELVPDLKYKTFEDGLETF